jgi:hypothetical protein
MKILRSLGQSILLPILLVCFAPNYSFGREGELTELREKVSRLERRVAELEEKVTKLEGQLQSSTPRTHTPSYNIQGWSDKENWRSLRRNMTKADVTRVLGEPGKISTLSYGGEIWYYPDVIGGSVHFDGRGLATSWSEP